MNDEDQMMHVCPQCGKITGAFSARDCPFCKCPKVSTGVIEDDYLDWEDEEQERWKKEIIAKYASSVSEETKQKRAEYDNRPVTFIPKCPTCGHYARALSSIESSIPVALEYGFNSKKAGKSFICDHCGYTW